MQQILPRKGWAAVYCRLSREDEEKTARESESIRNQRELLLNWAQAHGYRVYRVYIDEDYSGIDRGRPGFNAMLADAQAGKFEVILAKTQSRFTRDMELVERYLHGLFPEWGVRFIAVLDHVDTQDPAGKKARQINGLINEWYLEDLSANVRAVLDHKRHSGCYIASFALYGYRKHPADHNRLVLDPPAAAVVRKIFALYLAGHGTAKIAALLNKESIPPPAAYRTRQLGCPVPSCALWSKATVRRILATRTYAGDMEQGRVRKLNYKSMKTVRLPPQDWIVVPGTQEAIVDRADFDAVQRMLAARGRACACGQTHLLAGLVYCGICGGKMELTGTAARRYFRCRTAQRSRAACPGQRYLPMADAEALMQKLLCGDTAPLTRAKVCAVVNKLVVDPPQNGMRPIRVYARPGVVGQGTPAHVG